MVINEIRPLVKRDFHVVHPYSGTGSIKEDLIKHAAAVVQDERGKIMGVLTPMDIAQHSYNLVIDCLTPKPKIPSSCAIDHALNLMQEIKSDVLQVTDEDQFRGLVFKNDLVHFVNLQKHELHKKVNEKSNKLAQTQHHLTSTKKVLKAFFDSTQSVKILVSPDWHIMFYNKKAYEGCLKFYGVKLKIGDNLLKAFPEKHQAQELLVSFKSDFERALAGESIVAEKELIFPDAACWVRTEVNPVYDGGALIGVAVAFYNIDEQKQYEQYVKEQHNILRSISWVQSHKTRQPLASILGLLNIFEKSGLSEHNQRVIDLLEEAARKLDEIIKSTIIRANSLPEK